MTHVSWIITTTICATVLGTLAALAQETGERQEPRAPGAEELGATTERFVLEDGAALYHTACSGCHQPEGEGAVGAASYPPLAANPRLEGAQYPVYILLNGMGAMPTFADWLADDQIVAVVTYIQQNFGNDFTDHPTADMVADLRTKAEEASAGD